MPNQAKIKVQWKKCNGKSAVEKEFMGEQSLGLAHCAGLSANLVKGNFCLGARKRIIFGEEEHTVTLLTLLHGDAGAVPVGGLDFCLFVFVVAAGTQRRTKVVFVLGEAFDYNGRNPQVLAKVGAGTLGVALGKVSHEFETFVGALDRFAVAHCADVSCGGYEVLPLGVIPNSREVI